ncbi:MAG: Hint domain-containing protein [Clostridiales bacterium]|nr:Hint domain-containing protein [Clostridiales bacterium]
MLHENTEIMMDNGSMRNICDIKIGDSVWTETGCNNVCDIYSGWECSYVKVISSRGLNISLTASHPIKLKDGWKRVSEIKIGDKLCTKNYPDDKVESIQIVNEDVNVYNLEFDVVDEICANNFIVGDTKRENSRLD